MTSSPIAGEREAKEREAFVAWLGNSYPHTYDEADAEHYWRYEHVSALAWKARAALLEPVGEGAAISAYFIPVSDKRFADEILVQRSRQMEGPALWAVRLNGNCLNKSGEWEWEPMPSSRDDEFLARCRFATSEEAIRAARRFIEDQP